MPYVSNRVGVRLIFAFNENQNFFLLSVGQIDWLVHLGDLLRLFGSP